MFGCVKTCHKVIRVDLFYFTLLYIFVFCAVLHQIISLPLTNVNKKNEKKLNKSKIKMTRMTKSKEPKTQ